MTYISSVNHLGQTELGGTVCVIGEYIVCISHVVSREVAVCGIISEYISSVILRGADGGVTVLCVSRAYISSVFHLW